MKRRRKHKLLLLAWWGLYCSLLLLVVSGIVLSGVYLAFSKDLPAADEIGNWRMPEATRIYDRNGTLLYEVYGDERRIVVPGDQIAQTLKQATIAIEDERFYQHNGVDMKGIIRAFWRNLQSGTIDEGGSTITQQLAKNAYLTSSRTYERKIREMVLAYRLEQHYTKDQILTLYLNQIGYGSNAYGAEAAAKMYFNKSARDLSIAEAATLAALTKSPTLLSPYIGDHERLFARRNTVIARMAQQRFVPPPIAKAVMAEKITVHAREEKILAPHFVMYVKQLLTEKYGQELVEQGGLQVTTTLDLTKQQIAEQIAQNSHGHLARSGASNVGMVAIDPKNGEIMAMVGSKNYFDQNYDGKVNVTTSTRPSGSAFKPIIYAQAFEEGWAPGSTLFDLETDFGDERLPYVPKNYNGRFNGPVSIREALANSYNIPAIKMMALLGKNKTLDTAKKVGITTFTDVSNYGLSLAIGGGDVRLVELAGSYGAFANGGQLNLPTAVTRITQGDKVLFAYKPEPKPVYRPEVAYQMNSILSDNQARTPIFGPRSSLVIPNRTVAAKTGTTQEYRDAWTIGYTPSLVVGVWVGNNDYSPMREGSAGAMAAAPIWNSFISRLLRDKPDEPFPVPPGLQTLTVDAVTGQKPSSITRSTRQDIYAAWQIPTDAQLVNYQHLGCTGELIAWRTSSIIHSEKPDDPRWERPVIAWARANGYPTERPQDVRDVCESPPTQVVSNEAPPPRGGIQDLPVVETPEPEAPKPEDTREDEPDNNEGDEEENRDNQGPRRDDFWREFLERD